ncbi:MAG TPA: S41 family peptidase [Blastocatellia bacterium]
MRVQNHFLAIFLSVLLLVLGGRVCAQEPMGDQPDMTVDAQTKSAVIDKLIKLLNDNYVFPETAAKMEKALREHQEKKDYDAITSAMAFAKTLTDNLQDIAHDKHLRVQYSFRALPPETGNHEPSPEQIAEMHEFMRAENCGFEKLEHLPGNIGYLDFRGFAPPDFCAETASAAMNFLANSDALIVDLRHNGGGDPAMVAFLCSYLFGDEPVHLNDLYWRTDNSTHQWWTLPFVPGKRFGATKPVYVLTSKRTFSGAEEFTYNLKNLKRATIIGETTGGGANPGGGRRLGDHFGVFVPTGRAINPITKTNWEGTGIKPDVEAPADNALKVAQLTALKAILPATTDEMRKGMIQKEIDKLQKEGDGGK